MAAPAHQMLILRKLADRSSGVRETRWDPLTGEKFLYDPSTPTPGPDPWPLAGVRIENEGGPPKRTTISTSKVNEGRSEGWITVEGERPVMRSGGPPENPWKVDAVAGIPHVFSHADAIVFHTVDGDVRYDVVENPDKWPAEKLDDGPETGFGGEVRWYYDLQFAKDEG